MQRFVEPVPERPFTLPVIVGTSLSEGKQFIERLSDLCALNVLGKSALPELQALLFEKLVCPDRLLVILPSTIDRG